MYHLINIRRFDTIAEENLDGVLFDYNAIQIFPYSLLSGQVFLILAEFFQLIAFHVELEYVQLQYIWQNIEKNLCFR